jgi:hypothetical protein
VSSRRRLLTEPQYRLLKRLAGYDDDLEVRLGSARDRAVARRLAALDCARESKEDWWSITDHGRNILEMERVHHRDQEGGDG